MEFLGHYKGHTEATEGVAKSTGNAWRKVTGIFETIEHFPKTLAVDFMNSMAETCLQATPGKLYRVRFDIESREYNGKYYTNLKGWGMALEVSAAVPGVQEETKTVPVTPAKVNGTDDDPTNDLPF